MKNPSPFGLLQSFLALAVLTPSVTAQGISLDVVTATTISTFALDASGSLTQSLPAGMHTPINAVSAFSSTSQVDSAWTSGASEYAATLQWHQAALAWQASPSQAVTGANELLVSLSANAMTPVTLALDLVISGSPGAAVPACSIDVHDDGVVEVSNHGPATVLQTLVIGPQPVFVRLRSQLGQLGIGSIACDLGLRIEPNNNLVIQDAGLPCAMSGGIYAGPVFLGTGVHLGVMAAAPVVLVLGFGQVSLPLPAPSPASCVLIPSPDLLLLAGVLPGGYVEGYDLPLPATVRPGEFWVQGVVVQPNVLHTTNTIRVQAF